MASGSFGSLVCGAAAGVVPLAACGQALLERVARGEQGVGPAGTFQVVLESIRIQVTVLDVRHPMSSPEPC
ncbi:hypothetical protein [Streptomyces mirabilis]